MRCFIEAHDSKFINNTIISLRQQKNTEVFSYLSHKNLYKIYHQTQFDTAIFIASRFTSEIAQFVTEFYTKGIKIFVYHDTIIPSIIEDYKTACVSLVHEQGLNNTIVIPPLINDYIYKNNGYDRHKSIACFIDDQQESISSDLEQHLYPNAKLPIRMFNNSKIVHPLNLGLLNEYDKADVLNRSEYFLDINNTYTEEAIRCGCKIVKLDNVQNYKKAKKTKPNNKLLTYQNFIEQNLL
jgi:hypothetical protein